MEPVALVVFLFVVFGSYLDGYAASRRKRRLGGSWMLRASEAPQMLCRLWGLRLFGGDLWRGD